MESGDSSRLIRWSLAGVWLTVTMLADGMAAEWLT